MSKKISRRKVLSLMGQGGAAGILSQHPLKILLSSLLTGHIQKTQAQTLGTNPRNLLSIRLMGAPPRWTWDPLHPFDEISEVVPNGQVGTRFTSSGGRYTGVEYASVKINNINMPWMWQFSLPKAGGGNRPMSELMDSMLIIQGTNCANPAHSGALVLQDYPLGINHSISSLSADGSTAPIPFINMNGLPNNFSSKIGLSPVNLPVTIDNLLEKLLAPFLVNPSADFTNSLTGMESMIDTVLADLNNLAKNEHPKAENLIAAQGSAIELIKTGFTDIATVYPQLLLKYRVLVSAAADPLSMSLQGLSDQPIGTSGDLRTNLQNERDIARMAEQFAVAEYVFGNNLSSAMTVVPAPFQSFTFDEHQTDTVTSLAACTFWNRALAACLLELIDRLKEKGVYNDTVINISGEFGRNPRTDGTGSDHSPEGTSNTFLCGALKGNEFIGNTLKNSPQTNYPGTWGYFAANPPLLNTTVPIGHMNLGHLAASMATLLRVPSPVTAAPSLLIESNGVISSLLPGTKLV